MTEIEETSEFKEAAKVIDQMEAEEKKSRRSNTSAASKSALKSGSKSKNND